jgi:hypothetical protein
MSLWSKLFGKSATVVVPADKAPVVVPTDYAAEKAGRHARSKSEKQKRNVKRSYQHLLRRAATVLSRASELVQTLETTYEMDLAAIAKLPSCRCLGHVLSRSATPRIGG